MKKTIVIASIIIGATQTAIAKNHYETNGCIYGNCEEIQYLTTLKKETEKHIKKDIIERYKGRKCGLNIKIKKDGSISGFNNIKGDYELCNIVVEAMKNIKYPPPPEKHLEYKLEYKP
ncbi:tolA family protein [Escherichia coli]|uniref:cell envelope integrity TolA C-terminal domain-containing protein n=1 Tax=Escherichia coli TaxID=562 RepID=UPI00191B092A|nr:cell envelope integrity TolA C-terminal domain-containing protein [Escherichia coli]UMT23137.1 tolA family protein [Escherichia coli]UMT23145.1 tolA family protein [Escherichia coli]